MRARFQNLDHTRPVDQCLHDLRVGWYGGTARDGTAYHLVDVRALVRRAIENADARVKLDEALTGTIQEGVHVTCEVEVISEIDSYGRTKQMVERAIAQKCGYALTDLKFTGVGADCEDVDGSTDIEVIRDGE